MTQLIEAHVSGDGLRSYRHPMRPHYALGGRNDLAYAGRADQIANLVDSAEYAGWQIFGSPTQPDILFILARASVDPREVPIQSGDEPWVTLTKPELEEFAIADEVAA